MIYPYTHTEPQPPDREAFTSPYNDREQREHVRRLARWPEAGEIDGRTFLTLETCPVITGKSDALVSWLCRTLAAPQPHHLIMPIMHMVPVVVLLNPHGHLIWPDIQENNRALTDKHLEHWLACGQAFVIVVGYDNLLPAARAVACYGIKAAMSVHPKCRWFVDARNFAPTVHEVGSAVADAGLVLPKSPPPSSEQAFVASLKQMREDILRTIAHLAGLPAWDNFRVSNVVGRLATLSFYSGEERSIDLADADIDGNPLEALDALDNLLGYYS